MANQVQPTQRGKRLKDEVAIALNGQVFSGWESISVTRNLDSIANVFNIKLFDKFSPLKRDWPLKPGVRVDVNVNANPVMSGRIEKLSPSFNPTSRTYTISGRSKAGDLVDCGHLGPAEYINLPLDDLARKLIEPFGLKLFLSVVPSNIEKFSVKPGESVFEALDRAARLQGFFFVSTREGNLRLTRAARARATTSLKEGVNILSANANYDDSQRFSEYQVRGQSFGVPDFFGASVTEPVGKALDSGVTRYRPLVTIAESSVDSAKATTRAQWEASSRLARAISVNVLVQGWTQEDGNLWDINQLVALKSAFLGLERDMLITSVELRDSVSGGKETSITLTDPQAYTVTPTLNKDKKDDILASLGTEFS